MKQDIIKKMITKKYILFLFIILISNMAIAQENLPLNEDFIFDAQEELMEQDTLEVFKPFVKSENEVLFKNSTRKIDTIDPTLSASYFPGGRGTNKLIIYTPQYGIHTGTNEFGAEAIIENNVVVSLSGADSTIPKNGVVISGHGSAKNWIVQNLSVGSKVYIDRQNNTITVYTTSDSYMYEALTKIDEAKSMINYYIDNLPRYDYTVPNNYIKEAQGYLQQAQTQINDSSILTQYTQLAIESANMAIKTSLPYIEKEVKGTWIRPTQTTREEIISTLDKMKYDGFNTVFLETYFHGKTIFPSHVMNKYGFTVQNENFEGFDPLEVWVTEAHNRGIKVHIWFQSFYVGNKPAQLDSSSILSVHPEWGNKTKKSADEFSATKSLSEHNGYFIDPANPAVQNFLLELVDEIITTYEPDGINLDYVRYPNATAGNDLNAWGFTQYAREEFKNIYGVDPIELTTSDVLWYDWNQYRRNKISSYVKNVGELCRKKHTYISAVIFPDISSALSTKQQDWRYWSNNNYIDGFTPLFLTYDPKMLVSMMNDVIKLKSTHTQLYAGLFVTFMGGAPEDLIRQIYQTRRMSADGVVIFDYAHTTPVYTSTLSAGAFKKPVEVVAQNKVKKKFNWWKKEKKNHKEEMTQEEK